MPLMNDILAAYLKAYTSKKAADSVIDDIAVGTGSGLLGWVAGRDVGASRGEKLRQTKYPKIEHALDRIRAKIDAFESQLSNETKAYSRNADSLIKAKYRGHDTSSIESLIRKNRDSIDKLEQLVKKYRNRYIKTGNKISKLGKAIKNSRRIGGAVGAISAGLLGPILYNTLQKD